jgi:O-antigen/teichoic acid export membrane protein
VSGHAEVAAGQMDYGRSVSAQALARVVYIAAGTLVFVLLARTLGPDGLGRYALVVSLFNIATALADLGTTSLLSRDLAAPSSRPQVVGCFVLFRLALSGAVSVLAAAMAAALAPPGDLALLLACCALVPLSAARFFDPVFQVYGRPFLSAWLALGYAAIMPALTALALVLSSDPARWAVIAYAGSGALYGGAGALMLIRLVRPRFLAVNAADVWDLAAHAMPLGVSSLLGILTLRLDVVLLGWLGTSTMVGEYNAAFRFFDLGVAVIVTALTPLVSVFAHLAAQGGARLRDAFLPVLQVTTAGCLLAALIAPALSPTILSLLYGPAYLVAAPVLDVLAWKLAAGSVNLLLVSLLMTVASIRFVWITAVAGLACNIGLNLLLIPRFGIMGAAAAALLAEAPQIAVTLAMFSRALQWPMHRGWGRRLGATALATLIALHACPGPGVVRAVAATAVFLGMLRLLRAMPANPLPGLRTG